jgi:hypothetical protein
MPARLRTAKPYGNARCTAASIVSQGQIARITPTALHRTPNTVKIGSFARRATQVPCSSFGRSRRSVSSEMSDQNTNIGGNEKREAGCVKFTAQCELIAPLPSHRHEQRSQAENQAFPTIWTPIGGGQQTAITAHQKLNRYVPRRQTA